ncbi:armadillo repeat-containing protein [Vairimorpha necatrix]|uniref:Armadillo repeat-containing protein n=1 Tax=Vairimorpha necatrix TaxID=6039 RepID=A0AAX4JGN5_9MICR
MERELNSQLKQIQTNIKQNLINNNLQPTPENMIKYTAQTILNIENESLIPHLYSVIFVYKDFIKFNEVLNNLIMKHINSVYQDKVLRLVKILNNNDNHSYLLFKSLLEIFYDSDNPKIKNLLDSFKLKEDYAKNISDDLEFIKFYKLFFDELIEKVDFKERLISLNSRSHYILLLKYTKYVIDGPEINKQTLHENDINSLFSMNSIKTKKEKNLDEKIYELNYVINLILRNKENTKYGSDMLRIINEILQFNNIHFLKTKVHIIEITKEFKDLLNEILTNRETEFMFVQKFFAINKAFIIPNYISIVRNITSEKILQQIAASVDIEILSQIIKLDMNLVRFSTNNDISVFLNLYEQDNKMINIMPNFLDYCTDHSNALDNFYNFICMKLESDFFIVCTTLRNILRSHELNLKKELILTKMIPKETSERIIREFTKDEIFDLIIKNYQNSAVVNDLLFIISKYLKEEHSFDLENYDKINLFKFYIPNLKINLEIISKVLEECRTKSDNQKKFYEILYYLEKYNKININICSELFALDMVNNLQNNSLKWRIRYLFLRQKKGCCQKLDFCRINFINNLIISFYQGNKTCKEVCENILEELMRNSEYKNFIIRFIRENIENNDINLRCGSLQAYEYILRNNTEDLHIENLKEVYEYLFKIYKNINALIIIRLLTNYVLYTEGIINEGIGDIIEYYIDSKKKKYRKDIKYLIGLILSKKCFSLSRKVKQYYKFKIKTENEEIIIKKKQ